MHVTRLLMHDGNDLNLRHRGGICSPLSPGGTLWTCVRRICKMEILSPVVQGVVQGVSFAAMRSSLWQSEA